MQKYLCTLFNERHKRVSIIPDGMVKVLDMISNIFSVGSMNFLAEHVDSCLDKLNMFILDGWWGKGEGRILVAKCEVCHIKLVL